jgi:hypothetical protein
MTTSLNQVLSIVAIGSSMPPVVRPDDGRGSGR